MELNLRGTPRNWCQTHTSEISGEVRELGCCPSAAGVAKFLGASSPPYIGKSSHLDSAESPQPRDVNTNHGAESTGPWAPGVCTRESARLMGRTPRPQAQTSRAVGQQKPSPVHSTGVGLTVTELWGQTGLQKGQTRGPGLEEDGVWEASAGALAGEGGGCSCMGSRSVIRSW